MIKETLAQLVRIDSVSARSNIEVIEYLELRCRSLGFTTKRFPYIDEYGFEKINLVALSAAGFSERSERRTRFGRSHGHRSLRSKLDGRY